MKIKMIQSIAGHADPRYEIADFAFRPGEEVDVFDSLAEAWIASGVAVAVVEAGGKIDPARKKPPARQPVPRIRLEADPDYVPAPGPEDQRPEGEV
jgi:hypothetical protein